VGRGAAELIEEENKKEPFPDMQDFLVRTHGTVNRKCAEYLIKAGCFDSIDPDRDLLLGRLQDEISRLSDRRGLMLEKQQGLFADSEQVEGKSERRRQKDFKPRDYLNYEKEAFGFYLSGHPLEEYEDLYEALDVSPIEEIDESQDGKTIVVGGAVSARKAKRDKKGREYAIVTLQDFTGEMDVFVFAGLYEEHRLILRSDEPILVKGRAVVTEDDARPKLFSEEILPFRAARARLRSLVVDLDEAKVTRDGLAAIRDLALEFPGRCSFFINIRDTENGNERVRIRSKDIKVSASEELLERLKSIPCVRRVRIYGSI
jgi:DNA polymerase-3 subunit alpha